MLRIKVILGSTRENRFSEKPGRWILEELQKREGIEIELLDLRDYELPFFNQPKTPSSTKEGYDIPEVKRWADKIAEADGFVIVAPEYNHSFPAVLKNALDWVWYEWNKKPVTFVAYGNAGGARSVEQLRLVAVELELAPIRPAVHIPPEITREARGKDYDPAVFEPLTEKANQTIDHLIWWGNALKDAREKGN